MQNTAFLLPYNVKSLFPLFYTWEENFPPALFTCLSFFPLLQSPFPMSLVFTEEIVDTLYISVIVFLSSQLEFTY